MRAGKILALMLLLTLVALGRMAASLLPDASTASASTAPGVLDAAAAPAARAATPKANPTRHADNAARPKPTTMPAAAPATPSLVTRAHASPWTPSDAMACETERKALLGLRELKQQLEERRQQLDAREQAIAEMEQKAAGRIKELEDMEARLQDMLAQEKSINDKKIKRLTAVYEGMKPAKAAPVIARMELPIVVRIFSRMDEKKVGKILSFLPPEQAVKISQSLTQPLASLNP